MGVRLSPTAQFLVARNVWGGIGKERERAAKIHESLRQDADEYVRAACLEGEARPWTEREAMPLFKQVGTWSDSR
jgi:hypothetical protein